MKFLWLNWTFDTLFILVLLALSALSIRFIIKTLLRITIPLDLGVVIAISSYVILAWGCFYTFHLPLPHIFPWLAGVLGTGLIGYIIAVSTQKKSGFAPGEWRQWFRGASSFFLFALILITIYSLMIVDNRLPVLLRVNDDFWIYSKYAQFVLSQPIGNNVMGFDLFQNDLVEQTPTAFLLLSGLSYILAKPVVDIASLGLILLVAFSAHVIKTICVTYFQQKKSIAWLIALCWLSGPLIAKLIVMYFLAQWTGMAVYFAALWMSLKPRTLSIQLTMMSLLYYLLYMSYPGFYLPLACSLLFMQLLIATYNRKINRTSWITPGLIASAVAIPISAALGIGLEPLHFQRIVMALQRLANEPYFMSDHLMISPLTILSLPAISSVIMHRLIGWILVAIGLYVALNTIWDRWVRLLLLAAFSYVFFMTYETYFAIFLGLLLIVKCIDLFIATVKSQKERFNPYLVDIVIMVPVLLVLTYWIDTTSFMTSAYRLVTQGIVYAKYYDIDSGSVSSSLIGNIFLIASVFYAANQRHQAGLLTAAQWGLSGLFMANLLFYFGYYEFKGSSYQQWKLSASFVLPLSFVPVLSIFYLLSQKSWFSMRVQAWVLSIALLINWVVIGIIMSQWNIFIEKYEPLREVIALDKDPTVNRVIIDLNESRNITPRAWRGAVIAMQFIQTKPLEVLGLFTKDAETLKLPVFGEVLITNRCYMAKTTIQKLGASFCIIRGE